MSPTMKTSRSSKRKSRASDNAEEQTQKMATAHRKSSTQNSREGSQITNSHPLPSSRELVDSRSLPPNVPHKTGQILEAVNDTHFELDSGHGISNPQVEVEAEVEILDLSDVPSRYMSETVTSMQHTTDMAYLGTTRQNVPGVQDTLSPTRQANDHRAHHSTPSKESIGIFKRFSNLLQSRSKSPSEYDIDNHTVHQSEEVHGSDRASDQISKSLDDITKMKREFQEKLEAKEKEWKERERAFESFVSQLKHDHGQKIHVLQAKLHESESEKCTVQQEYDTYIRKQQEASFKQMESARWIPKDEGKVDDDLDRLKRGMRTWTKGASVKDISLLWSLEQADLRDLIDNLAPVVLLENNQLPSALSATAKAPIILLNALLAHSVYTSYFRTPFFFVGSNYAETLSNVMPEGILEGMYQRAKDGNQQDAHKWRSQTLRLWMPPLRNDNTEAEIKIRNITEGLIAQNANRQATDFLNGPARHLIDNESKMDYTTKLNKIYQEAASIAYNLWTRRTELKCFTLHEMRHLTFDAESPYFDPDNVVRYDDHEDQLKGMPVTVMVHPLLQVFGTDEAEDYHKGRVWAKGVVWLDSRSA